MKYIYNIRQIVVSVIATTVLIWASFKNNFLIKILISPFLICSIAVFFENLFLLLNKEKLANSFRYIYRASFFLFWFGFLIIYDFICIRDGNYILLLLSLIFWFIGIKSVRKIIFNKKNM